jgi:3-hydroxyisobutyrate dehydrogenase-like beta-hydroxyacid dehydrogenase
MAKIGMIGVGEMGLASAERLLERDHTIVAFDPNPLRADAARQAGVQMVTSPAEVMAETDGPVLLNVATVAQADAAWRQAGGALMGMHGRTFVVMSTFDRVELQRMAREAEQAGGSLVDAPHSGSYPAARSGTLVMWLAGRQDSVEAAAPVLSDLAATIHVVGDEPGMAQVVKLVNAVGLAINLLGTVEMIELAGAHGIDAATLLRVLELGSGTNYVTANWSWVEPMIKAHNVDNLDKDLRAALADAVDQHLSLPVTSAVTTALRHVWPRVP